MTGFACGLTALMCAALLAGAFLAQAPPAALVLIIPICVIVPMLAVWQATVTTTSPLSQLRRDLARLPETHHPLGL